MWVFPETSVLDYGYADMQTLFSLGPYVLMFLIPAITMRMFAEEQKTGTIELLLTKPITDWQLILGKFLSGWLLVILAVAPTLVYYFSVYQLGNPVGNVDSAGVAGSYVGLLLLGAGFTSIGILSSAMSNNQIVAFIVAVFLCFMMYTGLDSLSAVDSWASWSGLLEKTGMLYHYESMSRGLLDTRDIVYFISLIALMLLLTRLRIGSRQW
jgi:ABC-2 type transport system permease protein